ncbi:hypothetical protein [Terrisporobacter glycolicus]
MTYLVEAGFINKIKENLEITIHIINKQLKDYFIEIGDEIYPQTMIGKM